MTYEEAKSTRIFWNDYYDNQKERFDWKDESITPEEFFKLWLRKDEKPCTTLNESSTH
mgnify:FL=1